MNKNLSLLLTALFFAVSSTYLSACGSDDDSAENGGASKVAPVSEEIKPFVGLWSIKNQTFFLYQDKKCEYLNGYYNKELHTWDYDPTSRILAISGIADAQWQVTAMSANEFSAISLTNQRTGIVAKKDTVLKHIFEWIANGTWINGKDTAVFNGYQKTNNTSYSSMSSKSITGVVVTNKYYSYTSDSNGNHFEINYAIQTGGSKYREDEITSDDKADFIKFSQISYESSIKPDAFQESFIKFNHPYSYSGATMQLEINMLRYNSRYSGNFSRVREENF